MDYHSPHLGRSMSHSYSHASSNLEPMTLGSPPSSHHGPPTHGNLFLPGYLMGDMSPSVSPSSSRLWSSRSSPPRGLTPSTLGPRDSGMSVGKTDSRAAQRSSVTRTPKDKTGAPPVAALFDNVESLKYGTAVGDVYSGTPDRQQMDMSGLRTPGSLYNAGTPGASRLFSPAPTAEPLLGRQMPASPAQVDPFYTQGEAITLDSHLDESWVTIFGFPPSAAGFIHQQFSQYGNIIRHVVANNGNWMHVQYSSKLQAKKALSKMGKVYGGNIMIGVTPCIDKSVMEGGDQCSAGTLHTDTPSRYPITTQAEEVDTPKRISSIRPLTAAYKDVSGTPEVLQGSVLAPKSSNVVSKTLGYMFGW